VEQSASRLPSPIALPSSSAPSAAASYSWRCVSRAHCGKGCDPFSPLLSAPLRLAAASAGSAGRPAKDGRRLYVAIDEPSHHVATSQADAPRFRLLVACWALGRGRSAGALLSSAVSRPIRVVANNDAPGGAASFCVSLAMPADWDGLQPLVPAPLQAPASERELKRTCREFRPALQGERDAVLLSILVVFLTLMNRAFAKPAPGFCASDAPAFTCCCTSRAAGGGGCCTVRNSPQPLAPVACAHFPAAGGHAMPLRLSRTTGPLPRIACCLSAFQQRRMGTVPLLQPLQAHRFCRRWALGKEQGPSCRSRASSSPRPARCGGRLLRSLHRARRDRRPLTSSARPLLCPSSQR